MDLLGATPYFQKHPENLLAIDSHGTPARQNVLALVRGKGRRCLVLAGHFDTVSIANYSSLVSLACEPEALTAALIDELTAKTRNPAEDKALADLLTGDFLAGRGLLDMKSGLAAGIAALERFAPRWTNRPAICCSLRRRMRKTARAACGPCATPYPPLRKNSISRSSAASISMPAATMATAKKAAPSISDRSASFRHLLSSPAVPPMPAMPSTGVSAHLIGAEIMRAMETNSALCDEAHGEISPAPVLP